MNIEAEQTVKCNLKSPRSEILVSGKIMSMNVYHYFWALRGS